MLMVLRCIERVISMLMILRCIGRVVSMLMVLCSVYRKSYLPLGSITFYGVWLRVISSLVVLHAMVFCVCCCCQNVKCEFSNNVIVFLHISIQ